MVLFLQSRHVDASVQSGPVNLHHHISGQTAAMPAAMEQEQAEPPNVQTELTDQEEESFHLSEITGRHASNTSAAPRVVSSRQSTKRVSPGRGGRCWALGKHETSSRNLRKLFVLNLSRSQVSRFGLQNSIQKDFCPTSKRSLPLSSLKSATRFTPHLRRPLSALLQGTKCCCCWELQ